MKKTLFYVGTALAIVISLVGCNKEAELIDNNVDVKEGTPFSIIASPEETRTVNDGMDTKWVANDGINVFHAVAGKSTYVNDGEFTISEANLELNKFDGTINGTLTEGTTYDWFMIYPYNADIATPANKGAEGYVIVGSMASRNQTQAENDSKANLAGSHIPLYGRITNVASTTMPNVRVNHLCSFIEFNVTNNSGKDLTVSEIKFTGTEDISGTYFIDLTGDNVVFTPSADKYVSATETLEVTNGSAIANEGSAKFYMAIKPFTTPSTGVLKVAVNGYEKEINLTKATTFTSGKIKKINFNYNKEVEKDYVTLDWESVPENDPNGLTSAELGGIEGVTLNADTKDYAATNAPYLVKFSESTHYAIIKTDSQIAKVTVNAKGFNAGSGYTLSDLTVYGSSDGTSWTTIKSFSVSTEELTFIATGFNSADRYVKLGFTKAKNNLGIGRIAIEKPSTDPVINVVPITDVVAQGVNSAEWTYSVSNFEDDVEVADVTGCVTEATATGGVILYSVSPNYTQSVKNGTIVLQSASDHSVSTTLNVSQARSTLTVSANGEIIIPAAEQSSTFTITSPEFSWIATPTNAEGYSFTVAPTSGQASETAQTITVSSTVEAASTEQVLGTILVYRNGNASDSQKKTITVKKGYVNTGNDHTVKWTAAQNSLGYTSLGQTGTISTGDFEWSYERNKLVYAGWTSNCVQLGSSSGPENITFRTSNIPGTIKSVYVECSSYNAAHKVSITVGGTTYLAETATAKWTTISSKGGTGNSSGEIVISFTDGTRALYIKSITVVYNN